MTPFRIKLITVAVACLTCGLTDGVLYGSTAKEPTGLLLPAAIRCTESKPIDVGGQPTGFATCANGLRHRPMAQTCPYAPRPLRNFIAELRGVCDQDIDCHDKPNGSCEMYLPYNGEAGCNYGCSNDSDCGKDQICACSAPAGQCVPAQCRTDGDCKDGAVCGEYPSDPGCFELAYSCQTPLDQCASNEQCKDPRGWCSREGSGPRTCQPAGCMY